MQLMWVYEYAGGFQRVRQGMLPNQELSGAKSELQGGTVGACSVYKNGG